MAIDAQTGALLGGHTSDLATKAEAIHKVMRLLTSKIQLWINGAKAKVSYKGLFATRHFKCARDVVGIWLPGINIRPVWNNHDYVGKLVAANLYVAALHVRNCFKASEIFVRKLPGNSSVWVACRITVVSKR